MAHTVALLCLYRDIGAVLPVVKLVDPVDAQIRQRTLHAVDAGGLCRRRWRQTIRYAIQPQHQSYPATLFLNGQLYPQRAGLLPPVQQDLLGAETQTQDVTLGDVGIIGQYIGDLLGYVVHARRVQRMRIL